MSWIRVLIAFMAAAVAAQASITAAWKIPVERVAPSFTDAPPQAKPPGDSAFFQPGDKLWDLSKSVNWTVPDETKVEGEGDPFAVSEPEQVKVDWKGDWIVWNSRSCMIIARGSWYDILIAEHALGCEELPKVIRTRIEVKGAGKSRSLSLVSRSGQKASMEMNGLQAEVELTPWSDGGKFDSRLRVNWPADDNRGSWDVRTAVSLLEDKPCRIACHGAGDQRWELVVSTEGELLDGTPSKEFCWVETADGLKPRPKSIVLGNLHRKQLDATRWLGAYPMRPWSVSNLLGEAVRQASADINPPAELGEWVRNPLVNIRPWLEEKGLAFQDDRCFAGVDPMISTAFVVADQVNQDMAESLFCSVLDGDFVPPIWIETNPESGGWGLASRSGESAEIRRSSGNLADSLLFRSEATQGADGFIFDLHYTLDVVAGDAKIGKLEAATTLTKDKPQVIGSGTGADGKEVKVIVTASTPRE